MKQQTDNLCEHNKRLSENDLETLLTAINDAYKALCSNRKRSEMYSNRQVQDILHINDKLIRKYREHGLISYSKVGDKYWYTREDVEAFLRNNHFQAFT